MNTKSIWVFSYPPIIFLYVVLCVFFGTYEKRYRILLTLGMERARARPWWIHIDRSGNALSKPGRVHESSVLTRTKPRITLPLRWRMKYRSGCCKWTPMQSFAILQRDHWRGTRKLFPCTWQMWVHLLISVRNMEHICFKESLSRKRFCCTAGRHQAYLN